MFLEINGVEISRAANDDVYKLVLDVAAGNRSVEETALGLRHLLPSRS